jgi:hypothetical protein
MSDSSDNQTAIRRYTLRLELNRAQEAALERRRSLHSALYNALIQQRIEAWQRGQWTLAPTADGQPRLKRGRLQTKGKPKCTKT